MNSHRIGPCWLFTLIVLTTTLLRPSVGLAEDLQTRLRRPVALILDESSERLFVANERSGSVSVIDTSSLKVLSEFDCVQEFADLKQVSKTQFAGLDRVRNELVLIRRNGDELEVQERLQVPIDPIRLEIDPETGTAIVTSRWSRSVSFASIIKGRFELNRTLALAFPPQEICVIPGTSRCLIADAFSGELAVVDFVHHELVSHHDLPIHHISSLVFDSDSDDLLISHQQFHEWGSGHFNHLSWSEFIQNGITTVSVDELVDPKGDPESYSQFELLRISGDSSGDPDQLIVLPDERMFWVVAGSGNLAIADAPFAFVNVDVGQHPVAAVYETSGNRVFVANRLSDTITVVNPDKKLILSTISLGPVPELSPQDRGEILYFDANLANSRWMSCNSCHIAGHTNERVVDTLGDGDYGAPKRVPSLLGVTDTEPFSWDGSMDRLESQIVKSIKTTLHGPALSDHEVNDLAAYLNRLAPPPVVEQFDSRLVEAGRDIFRSRGCVECHREPTYTSPQIVNVGLEDELGRTEFNPPSLRGVAHRRKLFHDGRAHSLDDVLSKFRHQLDEPLSENQRQQLIAFLMSL